MERFDSHFKDRVRADTKTLLMLKVVQTFYKTFLSVVHFLIQLEIYIQPLPWKSRMLLEVPVGEFAPTKVKGLSKDTKGPLAKALR